MKFSEFEALAKQPMTTAEIRELINAELSGATVYHDDLRLVLASDLLCDAALEVEAKNTELPMMQKVVALRDDIQMDFSNFALVEGLRQEQKAGNVVQEELQKLALRGSVANAISNAVNDGADPADFEGATIALSPIGLINRIAEDVKPRGFFSRFFKRS